MLSKFLIRFKIAAILVLLSASVMVSAKSERNMIVVSADGSGNYTTIQAAVDAIVANKVRTVRPLVVYIKNGIYKEKLLIPKGLHDVCFRGEDAAKTIITWDDYSGKRPGLNTFNSYTVKILGHDLLFENLTIRNTEGLRGQAVALDVEGDRCVFKSCHIVGNQDTLYAAGKGAEQYFKDCYIEGTTDFIFGSSTAVFKDCDILCKKNSFITAASTPKESKYGFVFLNCKISALQDVKKVYLGRPWRGYANVVYKKCKLGSFIRPSGWSNWHETDRYKTAFYAEYNNSGPGSATNKRVSWSKQLTRSQAMNYTVENILDLSKWEMK